MTIFFPLFNRQMKNFLLMEVYSIFFTEYYNKPQTKNSFTRLKSRGFNPISKRFIFVCFGKTANQLDFDFHFHSIDNLYWVCLAFSGHSQNSINPFWIVPKIRNFVEYFVCSTLVLTIGNARFAHCHRTKNSQCL